MKRRPVLLGGLVAGAVLLLNLSGCQREKNCLQEGHCQCLTSADCPSGLDCINGVCGLLEPPPLPHLWFGEPCRRDEECVSGFCLPRGPQNGGVCSRSCASEPCPEGWECKWDASRETGGALCVQQISPRLCLPCGDDSQCNAIGDLCLWLAEQRVCALDCSFAPCPVGTSCRDVPRGGGIVHQCLPDGESCECSQANLGLVRPCLRENAYGICRGLETCQDADPLPQWTGCDAAEPRPEICNGLDDDCDGLLDALDPDVDVAELPRPPDYPACQQGQAAGCTGRWLCLPRPEGGFGWVCGALEAESEVCNGRDDDCNGIVDDPFVDLAGRYVHPEHCGGCGGDCRRLLDHLRLDPQGQPLIGSATCLLRGGSAACVPLLCEKGFWPYPPEAPVLCAPLVSPACQPCSQDDDCRVASDVCASLNGEPGSFCLQSCSPASPYFGCTAQSGTRDCCPEGYLCQAQPSGAFCLPEAGTCTCNAQRLNASRPCLLSGGAGEVCQGKQFCRSPDNLTFQWSACEPADVVLEVCDSRDNDCDGRVDEDFVDAAGRYGTDHHCRECNNDCTARWSPEQQHAIGGCVIESGEPTCRIVACTTEQRPAYGPCRSSADCPAEGPRCDLKFGHCLPPAEACPGPACGRPCNSHEQCRSWFGPAYLCREGVCQVDLRFVDGNRLEFDGCECGTAALDPGDEPDIPGAVPQAGENYLDRNCDGIDGEAAAALFVWSGSSHSQGTREHPYQTIAEALAAFDPQRHKHILVAAGLYTEQVVLRPGVKLYGGYAPGFASRDIVLKPTTLLGPEPAVGGRPGTVYAEGISAGRTVLSGFHIYGYDVHRVPADGQPGESSYAVYLQDCNGALELRGNFIFGGRGGVGGDGASGTSGTNGGNGADGRNSLECRTSDCWGESQAGGAGGQNSACSSSAGQPGATARPYCSNSNCQQDYGGGGINGRGGSDSIYGNSPDPSLCKYDCQVNASGLPSNGEDAAAGGSGGAGNGGSGCSLSAGQVVNGRFVGGAGSAGGRGQNGSGGGGGGAGGAVINYNTSPPCTVGSPFGDLGASGGGGGAGGCGGSGGGGGGGGGGSFGVFLYFTAAPTSFPQIRDNHFSIGPGGRGGAGGGGGQGGLGGQGGRGGLALLPAWCAGAAGSGGRGGDGGAGGGGGGGCGGVSFGLATNRVDDAQHPFFEDNLFFRPPGSSGGTGGRGGASPAGQSGSAGLPGSLGSTWVY